MRPSTSTLFLFVCSIVLLSCATTPQARGEMNELDSHVPLSRMIASLEGAWIGTLAYRDYQSDEMVNLPARMIVESSNLGPYMLRRLELSDPGRTVVSSEVVVVDEANRKVSSRPLHAEGEGEVFKIVQMVVQDERNWSLVLERPGKDGANAAMIREEHAMEEGALRATVRVQLHDSPDDTWLMRNELRLTRAPAPSATVVNGSWTVDLRPTPGAEPYDQPMLLEVNEAGALSGTFYGTAIAEARLNTE